jgi:thiamine-phosphate pyrophosphorylase
MINYLITDPKYYTNDPIIFSSILEKVLKYKTISMACFRDKISPNAKELASIFLRICKKYNIEKILINSNISLAKDLGFDGVHLTSLQFDKINELNINNLFSIISCHNEDEIKLAIKYNANMITYSPIFDTPNKGNPKGIKQLDSIVKKYNIPIIALGGIINDNHIKFISKTNVKGFASIRYFIDMLRV